MKKIALYTAASAFALALGACGDSDDASEDAMAGDVELPADEAMSDVPDPVADLESDAGQDLAVTQEQAETAADDAVDAVADIEAAAAAAAGQTAD